MEAISSHSLKQKNGTNALLSSIRLLLSKRFLGQSTKKHCLIPALTFLSFFIVASSVSSLVYLNTTQSLRHSYLKHNLTKWTADRKDGSAAANMFRQAQLSKTSLSPFHKHLLAFNCLQEFSKETSHFHAKWHAPGKAYPIPTSLVSMPDGLYVVFDIKYTGIAESLESDKWLTAHWLCSNGISMLAAPIVGGGDNNTLIIICPFTQASHITVECRPLDSNDTISYANLRVCQDPLPDTPIPLRLSACTSVRGQKSRDDLPAWIEYHRLIGFEHFIIHVNDVDPKAELVRLRRYIDAGLVTIIPFDFDMALFGAFFFQQASQVDCIYRLRHRSRWVALYDVDEFIEVLNPNVNQSLPEFLTQYETDENLAGILIPNWYRLRKADVSPTLNILTSWLWKADEPTSGERYKSIIRPERVSYFCVHVVSVGGKQILVEATEVRLNHYKYPANYIGKRHYDSTFAEKYGRKVYEILASYPDAHVFTFPVTPPVRHHGQAYQKPARRSSKTMRRRAWKQMAKGQT